jgi:short-subunit dehydrogenase
VRIDGSTVLLTGATGGIGGVLARRLAIAGGALVLTGRREDALASLAGELGARQFAADLAVPEEVSRLAEECAETDVLVVNAALPASGDLLDYTPEQIDRALAVNLRAPIMLARLLTPRMVALGHGHVVFVGSMSGKAATPASSLYTATKFGLRGFAHALRQDLRGTRVGVSLVQPGFVGEAGMFAATGARTPNGVRTVSPERVAAAVVSAVERNRAEVNVAPVKLRLRCAVAGQFPGLTERAKRHGDSNTAIEQIVEAQRALR